MNTAVNNKLRQQLLSWRRAGRRIVHEADTKALLAAAGIAVPSQDRKSGRFAVKLSSDRFPHKTEHGLVALNVTAVDLDATVARLQAADPAGQVLVEDMIEGGVGEWIVGCKHDQTFGPIVLAGPGGILVELLDQVQIRLAPTQPAVVTAMLRKGLGAKVLSGLRGKPAADEAALCEIIVRLSQFFAEHADLIEEIEVNPVIVLKRGDGAVAADALLVLKQPNQPASEASS
ncbi:MAG: acetate--CoA ligase family protein [Proteobacteria bacterium]|nr:acetate--CoA ligase family protein [Pseudomonadota bacterium]MCW5691028.1 acetate--CoA ligase family protein [Pseudolabrys sp.]